MSSDSTHVKVALLLLNDPDPVLVRVIQRKFQKDAGWESVIVNSYTEAIQAFDAQRPNLVLTEILINDDTEKTGFDVISEIRSKDADVPIVVFTELSQEEDKHKAINFGATHYFIKSKMTIVDVIVQLKKILGHEEKG